MVKGGQHRFRHDGYLFFGLLAMFMCFCPVTHSKETAIEVVWGDGDAYTARRLEAGTSEPIAIPEKTALGSVWKLFIHVYLSHTQKTTPNYLCSGHNVAEEAYCCEPGREIGRDEALAKSCSLYFSPARLGITATDWRNYWTRETPSAPPWLFELENMRPETEVSVRTLLAALSAIEPSKRRATVQALQRANLGPRMRTALSWLGSRIRAKTWSWHDKKGHRQGGLAGWLADGRALWLRGEGTSAQVIQQAAPGLAKVLPEGLPPEEGCVQVRFFSRYPLVLVLQNGQEALPGTLHGKIEARFENGQRLHFSSRGELKLIQQNERPKIEGRFGLNDYVARVLQREARAEPASAARALAVSARTYLVRHAGFSLGCYVIDDDSRAQRVSPNPPGASFLQAAAWSDGLVIANVAGHYHSTQGKLGTLSWQRAVTQANEGWRWDQIVEHAYGSVGFELLGQRDVAECQPLVAAQAWLEEREPLWRRQLTATPGFESPRSMPRVCRLEQGNPYADLERQRIYATGVSTVQERITLTHEYLHFGFAHHPLGQDERFIERTAQELLRLR